MKSKYKVIDAEDLEKLATKALEKQNSLMNRGIEIAWKNKESWKQRILIHLVITDALREVP